MKKSLLRIFTLLALCGSAAAQDHIATAPPRPLFETSPTATSESPISMKGESDPVIVRVDLELLAALSIGDTLTLNPPDAGDRVGVVDAIEYVGGDRLLTGRVEGVPDSRFAIAVVDGVAAGEIDLANDGRYLLRSSPTGDQVIAKVANWSMPECGNGRVAPPPFRNSPTPPPGFVSNAEVSAAQGFGATTGAQCVRPAPVYDLMVFYTPAVIARAGSEAAVRSQIMSMIPQINTAYSSSLIQTSCRLVYMGFLNYDENGSFSNHLGRLQDFDDGSLDIVNVLRDQYQADAVTLLVDDDDGNLCGLAYCAIDQDRAFSVVNYGCAQTSFSWQHEIGHNQGCDHNPENGDVGCGLHDNSHGMRFTDTINQKLRTVMAYDVPGPTTTYMRINRFSNPNVMFNGVPTGTESQHYNAATIQETRFEVERFRSSRFDMWVDFYWPGGQTGLFEMPFRTLAAAQNWCIDQPALAIPKVHLQPSTTAERPTLSKPMIIDCCTGAATIGI